MAHSITTSTNGGPQSWYNTISSPQLEIHSHRVLSMRIIELIQHKSRIDTTQVHILNTTQEQYRYYSQDSAWYYSQSLQYNITTSIVWGYIRLDMTHKLTWYYLQVKRMTPDVVQSTIS